MVFTAVPGSTFTCMGFVPCLVMICRVVWKDVWPSDALSVIKWPSFSLCFGAKCKM